MIDYFGRTLNLIKNFDTELADEIIENICSSNSVRINEMFDNILQAECGELNEVGSPREDYSSLCLIGLDDKLLDRCKSGKRAFSALFHSASIQSNQVHKCNVDLTYNTMDGVISLNIGKDDNWQEYQLYYSQLLHMISEPIDSRLTAVLGALTTPVINS